MYHRRLRNYLLTNSLYKLQVIYNHRISNLPTFLLQYFYFLILPTGYFSFLTHKHNRPTSNTFYIHVIELNLAPITYYLRATPILLPLNSILLPKKCLFLFCRTITEQTFRLCPVKLMSQALYTIIQLLQVIPTQTVLNYLPRPAAAFYVSCVSYPFIKFYKIRCGK